jgi:hypothetical protein
MSGILFNAGVDPERDEKARRAVKAFRGMQPTLTAYARMVTKRRDVRVELSSSSTPATDDKKIYYRPPIALGDNTPHERRLCDKRDENLQALCPACLVREKVLVDIFHEIGHIAKGSFTPPTTGEIEAAFEAAVAEAGSKYATKIKAKFDNAPRYTKGSLTGLAALINEYMPFLVNALEDARVDREMFKTRAGLKTMFDADVWRIFEKGIEKPDGTLASWKDSPQNTQVMVGAYCKAAGYDVTGWFIPPVEKALADEKLTDLVRRIDTVRSASGTYQLAFSVLVRLRELGFCGTPNDPDPEPEPQPQPEPESDDSDDNEEGDPSDDGQGEAEGTGSPSSEGESSGDGDDSSDEGEDHGDREPEEGEGSDRGDDGAGPQPGQADDQATSDGGLGDELDPTEEADGSEERDGEADSSSGGNAAEPNGEGSPEESPEQESEAGGQPEPADQSGSSDVSDEVSGQDDVGQSDPSTGSSSPGDGDEPSDREEPEGGTDHDTDSRWGQASRRR